MEPTLSFFLSPGRTGTQWIGDRLARHYADLALVEHEPIHADYAPCRALRAPDLEALADRLPRVRAQLDHVVAAVAGGRRYIEAGWCAYAWLPWFIARYGARVRLVHFTRHPVPFAYSMESHGFYRPELRDDGYTRDAQLCPTDPGVIHGADYAPRWAAMEPFEKCLYQWLEVNAYVLDVHARHPGLAYLHLRMEDLTGNRPESWARLMDFLDLPAQRLAGDSQRQDRVDRFRFQLDRVADPRLVDRHPQVLGLAHRFGYDPHAVDQDAAARRYVRSGPRRIARNCARAVLGRHYTPLRRWMIERRLARRARAQA